MAEDVPVPGLLGGGHAPSPFHHGQAEAIGSGTGSRPHPGAGTAALELQHGQT